MWLTRLDLLLPLLLVPPVLLQLLCRLGPLVHHWWLQCWRLL